MMLKQNNQINLKKHVSKGTGLHVFIGYIVFFVGGLLLTLVSYGVVLIVALLGLIVDASRSEKIMAMLKGNSIVVGPDQFPEIYQSAARMSEQLGLKQIPNIYIIFQVTYPQSGNFQWQ